MVRRLASNAYLKPLFRALNRARCQIWDLAHGVDTCGDVSLADLDFQSSSKAPGLEYQSHHPHIISDSLKKLGIAYDNYTFVDFGCGKGRVLLVASEFSFRRLIGVEFAPVLARNAERNVSRFRSKKQKCRDIHVVNKDALDYDLPQEDLVLYFYSPFPPEVMEQFYRRLELSLQECPRQVIVLFSGVLAARERAFGSRKEYKRLRRDRYVDIYQRLPASSSVSCARMTEKA